MNDMVDQFRHDFLEFARLYEDRAADIGPPDA
jgi:hypothetical protein